MIRPLLAATVLLLAAPAAASATATATLAGTTVTVSGDGADDTVALAVNAGNLEIDLTGDGTVDATFPAAAVTRTVVSGGGGDDALTAAGGTAGVGIEMAGGPGDDTLRGGNGDEVLDGGDGDDRVDGRQGSDTLKGGEGADVFGWSPGESSDTIDGGPGDDTLAFTASNANETVSLNPLGAPGHTQLYRDVAAVSQELVGVEHVHLRLLGGTDTFLGGATADRLASVTVEGGSGTDTLTGGNGPDTLIGGTEADTLTGGGGDDTFPVGPLDSAGDTIDGGTGNDRLAVTGTDAADNFVVDAPAPGQLSVLDSFNFPTYATTGVERLAIAALGGDDAVTLSPAAAAAATVDLDGGDGRDTLTGGDGADRIAGGDGVDRLDGGPGDDQLFGGAGADRLIGGAGADGFHCGGVGDVFDAGPGDAVDADCLPPVAPPGPQTITQVVTVPVPGPATPAPPAAPGPPSATADTRAPTVTLKGLPATIRRSALLRSGLVVTVTPSERAALGVELRAVARSARIAAAGTPNLVLAARALPLAPAGPRRVVLKPSAKLLGTAQRVTLTVRATATDAAGNARTVTGKVVVKR